MKMKIMKEGIITVRLFKSNNVKKLLCQLFLVQLLIYNLCGSVQYLKYYIISIAKTASKKIGALIYSMKFLSPEVAHPSGREGE